MLIRSAADFWAGRLSTLCFYDILEPFLCSKFIVLEFYDDGVSE